MIFHSIRAQLLNTPQLIENYINSLLNFFTMATEIKQNEPQIIVSITPNDKYNEEIIGSVKRLFNDYSRICYINTNTIHEVLVKNLSKNGIDTDNIFFIDCITKSSSQGQADEDNCIFVDAPNSLTEISRHVTRFLSEKKFDCYLFDSLSTLLIYDKSPAVIKFVHFLIENFRQYKCSAVFMVLESDSESQLIKYIGLFVDKIYAKSKVPQDHADRAPSEKIQKLDKELKALEEANKSGLISDESYQKGNDRIKAELEKLRK